MFRIHDIAWITLIAVAVNPFAVNADGQDFKPVPSVVITNNNATVVIPGGGILGGNFGGNFGGGFGGGILGHGGFGGHHHHGHFGGYGGNFGYCPPGYFRGPFIFPPAITVVPHGMALTADMLNGTFSTTLFPYSYGYGYGPIGFAPPVFANRAAFPAAGPNPLGQHPLGLNAMANAGGAGPLAPAQQAPAMAPPRRPRNVPAAEDEIVRRVSVLKLSTEAGRMRSDVLMADGDREFADQQYRRAAHKYRDAIAKAPDYSPSHLRAGHAYVATGDYDLAVTYFAMGFALARTTDRPGFSLADLYRGDALAKQQHEERLADAILREPEDGGLLFLTGATLHYDGHPLQARDYFRRAAQMPGRHQPYAAMFLPKEVGDANELEKK